MNSINTTMIVDPVESLSKKIALDKNSFSYAERSDAVAKLLARAGLALSPQAKAASSLLATFKTLEDLAGLNSEEIQRKWIALRSLDMKSGEAIGGNLVDDPIVGVFISAGGYIPTLDASDPVQGVIGSKGTHGAFQYAKNARAVDPGLSNKEFNLVDENGVLFVETNTKFKTNQILAEVSKIPSRHNKSTSKNSLISEVSYQAKDVATQFDHNDNLFKPYVISRLDIPSGGKHPAKLVESSALSSVVAPPVSYKPEIPKTILDSRILSDVQLESVIYAGQAHSTYLNANPNNEEGTPPRRGFLIGHGTGFGKTLTNAAIVTDNWLKGRRRPVWLIEKPNHIKGIIKAWKQMGGNPKDIINLGSIPLTSPIPETDGLLVATYSLLRYNDEKRGLSRIDQIVDWLGENSSSPISFDECQNLRYSLVVNDTLFNQTKPSAQGEAATELQDRLPHARVTYMSATGQSDIKTMSYAVRLGLWGPGTPFTNFAHFHDEMEKGGINALELVARDLKAMGLYLASNLSFEGVVYEQLELPLSQEEKAIQDRFSELWLDAYYGMHRFELLTNKYKVVQPGSSEHMRSKMMFGMDRRRFFQALLIAFKTKYLIPHIRSKVIAGESAIIQLSNTFEANANRAIEELGDGDDFSKVSVTAKDILIAHVENNFPIYVYDVVTKNIKRDASGNKVVHPEALAERQKIIDEILATPIPEAPLEQIINAFGTDMVAEVTGRKNRLVPGPDGKGRILEERSISDVDKDINDFQDGPKRILVFNESGNTNYDYHSSHETSNQSQRWHYILQLGPRADGVSQGLGRTHRSNMVKPPVYVLVRTDLWADRRDMSTIASAMQKLGAVTRGQRHASSQEIFTSDDDLEGELSTTAWKLFIDRLNMGKIPNMTINQFERETLIPFRNSEGYVNRNLPPRRFLNAMSAMSCNNQQIFGSHFKNIIEEVKLSMIADGSYDRGIETINPESLIKLEDTVIRTDKLSQAETRLIKLLSIDTNKPVAFEDVAEMQFEEGFFARSIMTDRVAYFKCITKGFDLIKEYEVLKPNGRKSVMIEDQFHNGMWMSTPRSNAKKLWDAEVENTPDEEEEELHIVSGLLLPLWGQLRNTSRPIVYRMETDEGESIIGRYIHDTEVEMFVKMIDLIQKGGLPWDETWNALHSNKIINFADGDYAEVRHNAMGSSIALVISRLSSDDTMIKDLEALGWSDTGYSLQIPADDLNSKSIWEQTAKILIATSMVAKETKPS